MSLYSEYVKERLGKLVFEDKDGFAVFYYLEHPDLGDCVYLEDIYVRPEARQKGHAAYIAGYIAEQAQGRGVKWMLGSVNPAAKGATTSLKVLLAYGMQLDSVQGGLIMFFKQIGE